MKTVSYNEDILVAYDVDVVVVGGGPAGMGAAFKAGQSGKNVLIIEQMNCLGGIATAGWHGHICTYCSNSNPKERVVGGTCYDLVGRILEEGCGTYDGTSLDFEVEWLKLILERMVKEIGHIQILYYTQFSDVIMENGSIKYIIIQNKSGRQLVKAKVVIDASGDADVAYRSGAPYEKGRPQDGVMQPMTLMFQIGGHSHEPFEQFRNGGGYFQKYHKHNDADSEVWKEAQANGDMEPFQSRTMGWWWCSTRPDQIGSNFTHIIGKDPTNAEDLTYATIEGRRQAFQSVDVFRKYLPGMENAWMSHTGSLIGTRESRRIIGEYRLTKEDLLNECQFDDSIGYGSFFIDIHNCTGTGMDQETHYPPIGFRYQIPYRALIPKKVDNLLVAGRCISCDHQSLGSLRVMPQCFLEGDAAGIAASIAVESNVSVRNIDVALLQKRLHENGAILSEDDIKYTDV